MTRSADLSDRMQLYRPGERRQAGPRQFTIGGFLGCGEALVLIGAPFSGKSAIAVAAAKCVATGEAFFGRGVRRGLVVYVPAERYEETDMRLEVALRGSENPPIRLAKARIYGDNDEVDRLVEAILAMAVVTGFRPALVIFDTVAALLRAGAGDENSQRDIGKLTEAFDRLREATGASIIVIHHAKRGEKRSRGSEALEGWADSVAIADGKGDQRRLSITRSNTIEDGVKATFALRPVDLGADEATGSSSAVVLAVPIEKAISTDRQSEPAHLSPDVETALTTLQGLPDPTTLSDWRTAAIAAFGEQRSPGARRQAFSAARIKLVDEHLIIIDGKTVSVRIPSE